MQPIFSSNPDYTKTALLNWRIENGNDILNILNLAEGYFEASISLAKLCIESNRDNRADILIFPIFTNINHGIELYLKAMTWTLNRLLDNGRRIEGGHNIEQMYQTVKARIKDYSGNQSKKESENSTNELKEYIKELFDKIQPNKNNDKMDFSRYHLTNNYVNHFYVDEIGNVEIDLENFIRKFEIIQENLKSISDDLYHVKLNKDY